MFAFRPQQFRHVVRASALYDLVVTAPFATPWTFAIAFGQLDAVNQALGGQPLPAFAPLHQLFALLMASVVLVWSWLRLRSPSAAPGRHDAATRLLFSAWMFWTWLQTGAPVMLLFLLPELAWAVVQAWPVRGQAAAPEHSARGNRAFGALLE
ncbi:MAG TPA: hypothetical protein VGE36_21520 [Roseateles sp.]